MRAAMVVILAILMSGCGETAIQKALNGTPSTNGTSAGKPAEPVKPVVPVDPEKEQFLAIVRENAENPSGLEIVTWGEAKTCTPAEGRYTHNGKIEISARYRSATFRCARFGIARSGEPVMLERAQISYRKDGSILLILFGRVDRILHPVK